MLCFTRCPCYSVNKYLAFSMKIEHNKHRRRKILIKYMKFIFLNIYLEYFFQKTLYSISAGEKTYLCDQCEYATNGRKNLYFHQKYKHSTYELECERCLYKTNLKTRLLEHNDRHHNKGESNDCVYCEYKAVDLQDRVYFKRVFQF